MNKGRSADFKIIIMIVAAVSIMLITGGLNIMSLTNRKVDYWLYPLKYEEEVKKYSEAYHVDKSLAQAVIREESKFNEHALSSSGAIGLMQIMPETGEWIAEQLNEDYGDLYDTDRNIRYGIWYLSELTTEFGGNKVLALAAYNAGHGTVWHWIEEYGWNKDFDDINLIPYGETRDYVRRVIRSCEKYKAISGG